MKNSKNKECTFKYLLCFVITSFANQEGICKPNKIIFQLPFVCVGSWNFPPNISTNICEYEP